MCAREAIRIMKEQTPKGGRNYIMAAEDVARVALLMAALPDQVNLYEAIILPNQMKSFIGRG